MTKNIIITSSTYWLNRYFTSTLKAVAVNWSPPSEAPLLGSTTRKSTVKAQTKPSTGVTCQMEIVVEIMWVVN